MAISSKQLLKIHSASERDSLAEIIHSDGWLPLLRQIESLSRSMEERVIKFDLYTRTDRELVIEKARAEGAAHLVAALKLWADQVKRARPDHDKE